MSHATEFLPDLERRRLRALVSADMGFDDGPGFVCWHTDCYRFRDETWQVAWSQATTIVSDHRP